MKEQCKNNGPLQVLLLLVFRDRIRAVQPISQKWPINKNKILTGQYQSQGKVQVMGVAQWGKAPQGLKNGAPDKEIGSADQKIGMQQCDRQIFGIPVESQCMVVPRVDYGLSTGVNK